MGLNTTTSSFIEKETRDTHTLTQREARLMKSEMKIGTMEPQAKEPRLARNHQELEEAS